MSLLGRVAIVTGASSGIGQETAVLLAKLGAKVIGTSSNEKGVKKIKNNLKKWSGYAVQLNFNKLSLVKQSIKHILKKFFFVDILVNNSGITEDNLLSKMTFSQWNRVLKVNLSSVFHMSKLIVPSMVKKKYGRIITVSSVVGFIGNIGQINYSAAKSGLIGFHKSLALELSTKNITVNVISPGYIETNMTKNLKKKRILPRIPMRKFGTVSDISNAILFLSSKESGYITGQTLHVNGGLYMN